MPYVKTVSGKVLNFRSHFDKKIERWREYRVRHIYFKRQHNFFFDHNHEQHGHG